MVGVLVHVDCEDRRRSRQAVRMIGRPLVDQPAQALGPREDHPARSSGQRLCHRGKLGLPGHDPAEVTLQRLRESGRRLHTPDRRIIALSTEGIEIELVQHDGARSNQLFALEPVDLEGGRALPIQTRKPLSNGVQPPQRAAVVVDVMTDEQPLRKPIHPLRLEEQRPNHQGFRRDGLLRRGRQRLLWVHMCAPRDASGAELGRSAV